MNNYSEGLTVPYPTMEDDLKREFEVRIADSSTLAFRVAYGVLRNREDAEDVAQEAFVRAYRSFSKLQNRERFREWLVRITWRLAMDQRRSFARRSGRETGHADSAAAQLKTAGILESDRAAQLWQAIDGLPEKLRITIILAGIEEYNTREVAALLDLPEGTVKSRLFLARQRLRDLLK